MVNKVFKNLSLSYLSDHIGIEDFNLAKNTYELISEDGHFDNNIKDKVLASLLFLRFNICWIVYISPQSRQI